MDMENCSFVGQKALKILRPSYFRLWEKIDPKTYFQVVFKKKNETQIRILIKRLNYICKEEEKKEKNTNVEIVSYNKRADRKRPNCFISFFLFFLLSFFFLSFLQCFLSVSISVCPSLFFPFFLEMQNRKKLTWTLVDHSFIHSKIKEKMD